MATEIKAEEFVAGRDVVVKWKRLRRQSHWFDALCNGCAAASFCRVRLLGDPGPARRLGHRSNAPVGAEASEAER